MAGGSLQAVAAGVALLYFLRQGGSSIDCSPPSISEKAEPCFSYGNGRDAGR